jgi:hypothetical protein
LHIRCSSAFIAIAGILVRSERLAFEFSIQSIARILLARDIANRSIELMQLAAPRSSQRTSVVRSAGGRRSFLASGGGARTSKSRVSRILVATELAKSTDFAFELRKHEERFRFETRGRVPHKSGTATEARVTLQIIPRPLFGRLIRRGDAPTSERHITDSSGNVLPWTWRVWRYFPYFRSADNRFPYGANAIAGA